jgi:hypothetical protein
MPITPLPTPAPSRTQTPAAFSASVDALLGALPGLVTQINATETLMDADAAAAAAAASAAAASQTSAQASATAAAASAVSAEATAAAVGAVAGLPSMTGNAGRVLTVNSTNNGVLWGGALNLNYQVFTASGTWTKPAGCTFVYVECIGAGGSGSHDTAVTAQVGGAGGGYADILLRASALAGTVTVTVGAGGAGVLNNVVASGNSGGASFFGTHLNAPGGRGGVMGGSTFVFNTTSDISSAPLNTGNAENLLRAASADGTGGGYGSYLTGGNAMKGGGGGGGSQSGGVSQLHGSGGAGNNTLNLKGGDGVAPGGGGGGSANNGGSGSGARGEVRVWAW